MKKRPLPQYKWKVRRLLQVAGVVFMLFVAYKILTPPTDVLDIKTSPDGKIVARLRAIYYLSDPVYKIDYHQVDHWAWRNLYLRSNQLYSPESLALTWGKNSGDLLLFSHEKIVWKYSFKKKKDN
jgi:hypothetical protein